MPSETKTHRFLRLILFLSSSYPRAKEECISFLEIKDSAFYNYRNVSLDTGFDVQQKDGKYRIEYPDQDYQVLRNVLHFSEEDPCLLARCLDMLKQILLINYASGKSQTVKNRLVEPCEFKDDFNLVLAFDTAIKQNRQFKICRIEGIRESPLPCEYERKHRSKPVDLFRNTGDLNKKIECSLSLRARNLLIEEYPLAERFLSPAGKNKFVLNAPVAKYEGPARFVMGLPEDVQVSGDEGFSEYFENKILLDIDCG